MPQRQVPDDDAIEREVARIRAARSSSKQTATPSSSAAKPQGDLFLYVPVTRLIILSIASFGAYKAYWIYKNWNFIKEREGLNIHSFWRGIFGVFFCHSLLRKIHGDKEARAFVEPTFSPGTLATAWVILVIVSNIFSRVPGIVASIIAAVIPSYLCLVPVQNYINSVTRRQSPGTTYYGWSSGHIVCLVFGVIVWGLALLALAID